MPQLLLELFSEEIPARMQANAARDLERMAREKLAADLHLPFNKCAAGDYVTGIYRQRFALASGRFAMIDDGLGFQLVPWTPALEKKLGQHISGIARGDGAVGWSFGRKHGIGL